MTVSINIFVYKIYLLNSISLIFCCNFVYLTSGEVHNRGKVVLCPCVTCGFSVIWLSKWDLMLIINIFVYKISLIYSIARISRSNVVYWIYGEIYTIGKTVVCTCIICCFTVILQSKGDLMLTMNIFFSGMHLVYWVALISNCNLDYCISGEVKTTGKIVICTSVIFFFRFICQSKRVLILIINIFVFKIYLVYWIAVISHFNMLYWISGEFHTIGKTVVCTSIICCFSVIFQSKSDLMLIINIFVYKIYLLYWIALISPCNLLYWISGKVHTATKTAVCTCVIFCFSVIWQSK